MSLPAKVSCMIAARLRGAMLAYGQEGPTPRALSPARRTLKMRLLFFLAASTALAAPVVHWAHVPLSFEPNAGQAPADVSFLARGSSYSLCLGRGSMTLAGKDRSLLRTRLVGANLSAGIHGESRQTSTSNYFVGSDPRQWHESVPNYGRVRYAGVYPDRKS